MPDFRFNRPDRSTEQFTHTPPPDSATRAAIVAAINEFPLEGWGPHRLAAQLGTRGYDVSADMVATVMNEIREN